MHLRFFAGRAKTKVGGAGSVILGTLHNPLANGPVVGIFLCPERASGVGCRTAHLRLREDRRRIRVGRVAPRETSRPALDPARDTRSLVRGQVESVAEIDQCRGRTEVAFRDKARGRGAGDVARDALALEDRRDAPLEAQASSANRRARTLYPTITGRFVMARTSAFMAGVYAAPSITTRSTARPRSASAARVRASRGP